MSDNLGVILKCDYVVPGDLGLASGCVNHLVLVDDSGNLGLNPRQRMGLATILCWSETVLFDTISILSVFTLP